MLIGQRLTVLGAGIGGLAVALACARRGAVVEVIEQAGALREVGAGLQISPNGMAVLDALGVGAAVAQGAPRGRRVWLVDGIRGRRVVKLDLTAIQSPHPWCLVHRADLVAALGAEAAAAGVRVRFATRVAAVAVEPDAVRLSLEDGRVERPPLVIAADGVRSVARAALGPAPAPRFTGQTAWRALVPLDAPALPEVRVFLGPGRHLVAYPLRDGRLMNLVAVEERAGWAEEGWSHPDDPARMRAAFAGFGPEARGLLERVGEVHRWGLFRHPVAGVWGRAGAAGGGLAGLGDAIHPTLPFLAQGACMALEDAWVLARALAEAETPAGAFAAYQATRRDRALRTVAAAGRNAWAYHLRGPVRPLAHAGLRLADRLAPGAALRGFDWLYTHDVTR
jgi:salicylate hydroxylase